MQGGVAVLHASWRFLRRLIRTQGRRWVASLLVVTFLASPLLPSLAEAAGLGTGIDSFLRDWEGQVTMSKPNFYEGQTRGYITGGSFDMRFPNRNVTPFAVTMPSISAGCGGVSLMGGAFSFINMQQFTQYLQAIAQNAMGMAFNLALTTLCPQCATVLSKLEQIAREVASNLKNSCKMTKEAFEFAGLTPDKLSGYANENCKLINSSLGEVSDIWGGDSVCKDPGATQKAERAAINADPNKGGDPAAPPPNLTSGNLFWAAYLKIQGDQPEYTLRFGEELMSLYGTFVVDALNYPSAQPIPINSTLEIHHLLNGWDASNAPDMLFCDEYDKCLQLAKQSGSPYAGLVPGIKTRLVQYVADYTERNRNSIPVYLTQNIVGIPMMKLLANSAYIPGQSDIVMDVMSRYLAVFLLKQYVRTVAAAVKGEAQRGWSPIALIPFNKKMEERETQITADLEQERQNLFNQIQMIQKLVEMTNANQGSNSNMFSRHTAFTSKMLRGGAMGH